MPMFTIRVTEQPRTGQRKPRIYWFVTEAADANDAAVAFRSSLSGACYGVVPGDTLLVEPVAPGEVLRLTR